MSERIKWFVWPNPPGLLPSMIFDSFDTRAEAREAVKVWNPIADGTLTIQRTDMGEDSETLND